MCYILHQYKYIKQGKEKIIMNRRRQFFEGIEAGIPVMIGFIPIAMTFAMLASKAGFSFTQTNAMSILVLAGASQMMAVNMLTMGAGIFEIVFATFILNLRHFIMSTYVMNRLKKVPIALRLILAFGVTDETFAIFATKSKEDHNPYFFAGIASMTYFSWVTGTVFGAVVIQYIPSSICNSMSIALYAMFIALLVPAIKINKKIGAVVLIAIILNLLFSIFIPSSWSIILATIMSAYIGTFIVDDEKEEEVNYAD